MSPWGKRLTGGCQCGAVRYQLATSPLRASICHCRMCQKACGQPFMAFTFVKTPDLRWTRGAPSVFRSSNMAQRGFCSACGTPLTYQFHSDAIAVMTGSLDDPTVAPPTEQYGVESMVPWCATIGGLPRIRTDDDQGPEVIAKFANYQHPDHDT
jgi:hypothetical protein